MVKNLMRAFDSAMRLMFPPDAQYPAGITTGNQEFAFFGTLTLAPVFFLGWNFWLMMGVLIALMFINTVRYYLFYDIVDNKHRLKKQRPSPLTPKSAAASSGRLHFVC